MIDFMLDTVLHFGGVLLVLLAFLGIVYLMVRIASIALFRSKAEYDNRREFRNYLNRRRPDAERKSP